MKKRKTIKRPQYTIEEKNKIVEEYLSGKLGGYRTIAKQLEVSDSVIRRWVLQYQEFGTTVDRRGKATKKDNPNKGRPRKAIDPKDMTREQLIERVNLIEDIKKVQAYLVQQKKNIK